MIAKLRLIMCLSAFALVIGATWFVFWIGGGQLFTIPAGLFALLGLILAGTSAEIVARATKDG